MGTMVAKNEDLTKLMNDLIALDYDAIEAYAAAIERLGTVSDKDQLARFMQDHRQHVIDLSALVRDFGEQPPTEADYKKVLTKGRVVLAGLIDNDAILWAMKSNEDDTNRAYERAVQFQGVPERILAVFQKNLADERRHRDWIEIRLGQTKGRQAFT